MRRHAERPGGEREEFSQGRAELSLEAKASAWPTPFLVRGFTSLKRKTIASIGFFGFCRINSIEHKFLNFRVNFENCPQSDRFFTFGVDLMIWLWP